MRNKLTQKETLLCRDALNRAINNASSTSSPEHEEQTKMNHPGTDPVFIESVATDSLSPEEYHAFLEHLADCPACRQAVAFQLKTGALFAESEDTWGSDLADPELSLTPKTGVSQSSPFAKRSFKWVGAIALLAFLVYGVLYRQTQQNNVVAKRDFISHLAQVESSTQEDFSPRLIDYGYRLSGTRYVKGMNQNTASDGNLVSLNTAYENLSRSERNDPDLSVRLVKLILAKNKNVAAAKAILAAFPESKRTVEMEQLFGISEFLLKNDGEAQVHFRRALEMKYDHQTALNLAISLTRSDQFEEAKSLFEKVMESTDSESLKLQIETFLKKREENR